MDGRERRSVEVDVREGEWTIRVVGPVNAEVLTELEETLDEAIAWSVDDVVVDLPENPALDEAAVGVIVEAQRALAALGRRLVVVHQAS